MVHPTVVHPMVVHVTVVHAAVGERCNLILMWSKSGRCVSVRTWKCRKWMFDIDGAGYTRKDCKDGLEERPAISM